MKRRAGIEVEPLVGPDEKVLATTFAKRNVFFASEQDLKGRLVLTTKRLRYIGLDTQKTLLSVASEDILSISCKRQRIAIDFRSSRGKKERRKYKLLSEVSEVEAFQRAVTQWGFQSKPQGK